MKLAEAGTFDIECADWDVFRCGAFSRGNESAVVWDGDSLFAALVLRGGTWWSHSGGRYDIVWVVSEAVKRGLAFNATMAGSRIISLRVAGATFRDSAALAPMRLADVARLGGAEKAPTGLRCECGEEGCAGFCVLRRPLSRSERTAVGDYCLQDCRALSAGLDAIGRYATEHGITLAGTIGGSAWKTAADWCELDPASKSLARYRTLRRGYYGGRTEVFRTQGDRGHRYDIHSSYPAALARTPLPVGESFYVRGEVATRAFLKGADGVYDATVCVPDCDVPPLPHRRPDRLYYPTGTFRGFWTGLTLRNAIDAGARVRTIHRGHAWKKSAPLLAPFAERVWALRDAAPTKEWKTWVKFLANSCTGKFAQSPERGDVVFLPSEHPGSPPYMPPRHRPVRDVETGTIATRYAVGVSPCAHVVYAAHLTSEAHAELHRELRTAVEPWYTDTDSVYSRDVLTRRIGPALGEWGYEGEARDWHAQAPKLYRYRDEHDTWHVRGKGMPGLTSDGFDALARGEQWVNARGVMTLRSAIRATGESLFRRREIKRGTHPVAGWVGGRLIGKDGLTTRAPRVIDITR